MILDKYASSEEMKKLYDFNEDTDVQFLNKMYQLDDGKLMMGLIAKEIHNENSKEDTQLNPEVLMQLKTELSNKANKNEGCEPVIKDSMSLSKKYYELHKRNFIFLTYNIYYINAIVIAKLTKLIT